MSNHPFSRVLQSCAGIVLVIAILATIAMALDRGQFPRNLMDHLIPAALVLAGGVGICGIILGLLGVLEEDRNHKVTQRLLSEIRDNLGQAPPRVQGQASEPKPQAAPSGEVARLAELLEEIREIALMPPDQRAARYTRMMATRRADAIAEIEQLLQQSRTAEAQDSLERAASLMGDAPEFRALSERIETARRDAEQKAFAELENRVRDLQATDKWDEAIALAQKFASEFATSSRGRDFLAQLQQLYRNHVESLANSLYEEVKLDIEQRSWRRALGAAQRLLASCPEHPRAQRIQAQLDLIRRNAETEQRNAMEARIQEFVRAGRLKEAIEVAEDLVRTFPLSNQAQVASQLIEKLRERMAAQDQTAA